MTASVVLALVLISLQSVFTAVETAALTIERSALARARREQRTWARRATKILAAPERFFATILVCEDYLLVIASTLLAQCLVPIFGSNSILLATLALSLYSLFAAQYLPKSFALQHPERGLQVLITPVYVIEFLLAPVVAVYAGLARIIASLFRNPVPRDAIRRSDIFFAVSEYEEEASKLIARLFTFSHSRVRDVMVPYASVASVAKGRVLEELRQPQARRYTRVPVVSGDAIVGIFNTKDYFYHQRMTLRKPYYVTADARCMATFLTMKDRGEHIALVRDDQGAVCGLLTLEDLIEELVGEIREER